MWVCEKDMSTSKLARSHVSREALRTLNQTWEQLKWMLMVK